MNNYLVVFFDTTNPKDPLIRNQIYETDKTMLELVMWLTTPQEHPEQHLQDLRSPRCVNFAILNIIKLED